MKSLLLIGGLLGFCAGLLLSWASECSWPACLWHGSLAAYLTSLLMRWWGSAWRKNLEDAMHEAQNRPEAPTAPLISKPGKS
ncbi:MAG TPA: hypothetical protein VH413_05160 [Verrucomicrobiae bacterium]|jgi:hypothetical protein|nr:hypothetical protein [Verrucomicrobiae bacterium]